MVGARTPLLTYSLYYSSAVLYESINERVSQQQPDDGRTKLECGP